MLRKTEHSDLGVTGFFTYQSGHRETVSAGKYHGWLLHEKEPVEIDDFTSRNNFRLPGYIRLDCGFYYNFDCRGRANRLHVGVYNVLNRHNMFTINYNAESDRWETLSLLPSVSYAIRF